MTKRVPGINVESSMEGWLGTPNYNVTAKAVHKDSRKTAWAQNESAWESRQSVERRAIRQLKKNLEEEA